MRMISIVVSLSKSPQLVVVNYVSGIWAKKINTNTYLEVSFVGGHQSLSE